MKKTHLFVSVLLSFVVLLFLSRCEAPPPPTFDSPASIGIQATKPYTISKSCLSVHYTNTISVTLQTEIYPLTITCELRPGGGLLPIARQVFTYTVSCASGYTSDPVVPPFCLVWELDEPLPPGWYEEFCKEEIPGPHYGWIPGEGHDGENFFMLNHWEIEPYRCLMPLMYKNAR